MIDTMYETIYFDISGTCNARCTYCNTGLYAESKGKFITLEDFKLTVNKLVDNQLLSVQDGCLSLYCWGEPFLHPQINQIIEYLNSRCIKYAFSTNASRVPLINKEFVSGLQNIVFSMPGFSQDSYDKIHGFNFPKIIQNILKIINDCRRSGYSGIFTISYHTYQFSAPEIFECEAFALQNKIEFKPVNAIQNNWNHIELNAAHKLPEHLSKPINKDLFYDYFEEVVAEAATSTTSEQFECPMINSMLVIDEQSNVLQCCQVPAGETHSPGNLLKDNWETIASKKTLDSSVCRKCIALGMAQYFQSAYKEPPFYLAAKKARPLLSEYLRFRNLALDNRLIGRIKRKIKSQIRLFKQN